MTIRRFIFRLLSIGMLGASPVSTVASEQIHLLGFVENLCREEPYCFELRVEADYAAVTGNRITVRFEQVTTIFDPENYELTLAQSNIIRGSHLRMLLVPDPEGANSDYRANYIWMGD